MIIGKVAQWMGRLDKGQAVVIEREDVLDSASAYRDGGFDYIRPEYIKNVVDEVNGDEYPEFSLWERPDGRWTLER
jgi:hypothetical protein|tara:strand:- start:2782 stop:3009 length:228 start_codon:yes stop_codon:yes gene_type:complete